ncbi:MAG: sugar phosphate isomerase/epimerase family protein [Clostridia bacterium]|nr:sugar phosphate isomerase/epimerase family protein [Clostridia bacterium]
MIKLGICAPLDAFETVAQMGFDYMETGLVPLYRLSDEDFARLCECVDCAPIRLEAFNGMLPGTLPVTGPNVDEGALDEYLEKSFARAHRLGAKVIVFGSGAARGVPAGFPIDEAWRQLFAFLKRLGAHAEKHELTIAIEPLCRPECNLLNLVSEGAALASILNVPQVRTLADTFHMAISAEPASVLTLYGAQLAHVHTANPNGRVCPEMGDGEDYEALFRALKDGSYDARVSIEGIVKPFEEKAPLGLRALDCARRAVWG